MSRTWKGFLSAFLPAAVVLGAADVLWADGPIALLDYFRTGYNALGDPWTIPSIDPAGVTYHDPSAHLFIADSEINEVPEVFSVIGANVFETSPTGNVLYASYDLTLLGNFEPTGIAYNAADGYFYVTNDDELTITRYAFNPGSGFEFNDEVNTLGSAGADDPEGITCDPVTGLLYAVDGFNELIVIYSYDEGGSGFVLEEILDLNAINVPSETPVDPEGIAYDTATGTLLVVSALDRAVYEYTTEGLFLERYDVSWFIPPVIAPQGLAVAPTSDPGDNPFALGLYIADARIDNNQDPEERDGMVYQAFVGIDPCGNGQVDPGEDCATCPADVPCLPDEECVNGVCQPLCGNGLSDPGEDCENCPQDIECPPGTECVGGTCERLCPWDCGDPADRQVGVVDFLAMLSQWDIVGSSCDFDDDGVSVNDFLALLAHWGPCP